MPRYDRLLSELTGARWTASMMNHLPKYLSRVSTGTIRLSTMPPSPASESTRIKAKVTTDLNGKPKIVGYVEHQPSEVGKRLMKELPEDQITWRSRTETVMSNLTQKNEFEKRIRAMEDQERIARLNPYIMPTDLSERIYKHKIRTLIKHLKIDPDHIRKYVKEHKTSSVSPGLKWADLPDPDEDMEFWRQFHSKLLFIAEEYLLPGYKLPAFPFHIGGRARTEVQTQKDQWDYDFESERSRIVMFHPSLSLFFVFVPDKKSFYTETWDGSIRMMGFEDEPILFPPVHGGEVYYKWGHGLKDKVKKLIVILGDDFNLLINGKQISWDGSNWEQFVPIILGSPWNPCFTSFGGFVALPSGVWSTTIDGSIAMAWLAMNAVKAGEDEIEGVWELQPEDMARNFMLGLRYVDDPMYPRLQGLKLTVDDATKTRRLRADVSEELTNKYKEAEILSWYNAYHGLRLDGGSLLDSFAAVDAEDWVNPSKLAKEVIFNQAIV